MTVSDKPNLTERELIHHSYKTKHRNLNENCEQYLLYSIILSFLIYKDFGGSFVTPQDLKGGTLK